MKKRFYFTVLVLAMLVLALPRLAAKAAKHVARYPRRFARRFPGSIGSTPAGRLTSGPEPS